MKRLLAFSIFVFLLTAFEVLAKSNAPVSNKGATVSANSQEAKKAARLEKWKKLHTLGTKAMVQNTIDPDANGKVGVVAEIFKNGDIKIKMENGDLVRVRRDRVLSLAAPVGCGNSNGVKICEGENVYYPSLSTSLEIPEGKVDTIFDNGKVFIKDGIMLVKELQQLGKETRCSPQDESVCVDDYVMADSYKQGFQYSFEGKVVRALTNGVVIVKAGNWVHPIDVRSVSKRIAAMAEDADNAGAVVSSRAVKDGGALPFNVTPEVEAQKTEYFNDAEERNQLEPVQSGY